MERLPKISVIIPTYNMGKTLRKCLDSLRNQTFRDYEVIIVDDGSEDDTKKYLVKDRRFRYVRQENQGPAAARNNGIFKARGKIIAFTDADCVVDKDWLKFVDLSFRNKDVNCVKGRTEVANRECKFANELREHIYKFSWYASNNIAYSKAVLDKLNNFDESFPIAASEDGDLGWRFKLARYKRIYCPEMIVFHIIEKNMDEYKRNSYKYGIGMNYFVKKYLRTNPLLAIGQVVYQIPPLLYFPFFGRRGYLKMIQSFYTLKGFFNKTFLNKV